MNKVIEELRKTAEPVHDRCRGIGFAEDEKQFLSAPRCTKIDPLPVYDLIDEDTDMADPETEPTFTTDDPACRCSVYAYPSSFWRRGRCPMATHFDPYYKVETAKVRVGQQKQKKKR